MAEETHLTTFDEFKDRLIQDAADGDPGEEGERDVLAEAHEIIEHDGLLVDKLTGEIMGLAGAMPGFFVDTTARAEWVLRKMQEEEAAIIGLRAQQSAIMANIDKMAGERVRRLGWLHWRFDHELADFAKNELERSHSKTKTWRCAFGTISFRVTKGTNKIVDMKAAVEWARRNVPQLIKVQESVNVSEIVPCLDDGEQAEWLERTPGGERASVATGVKGGGE